MDDRLAERGQVQVVHAEVGELRLVDGHEDGFAGQVLGGGAGGQDEDEDEAQSGSVHGAGS